MLRDLTALGRDRFDVAIIGGGATGAFIAWEAAHRGLRVALVDKGDFCHATSAANSRLIHGGLRYLAQGQLRTVRESARERSFWLRAAPHLVAPLPFLLPARSAAERRKLGIGLRLYHLLGSDRDRLLPRPQPLAQGDAERLAPWLGGRFEHGAWLYHDAQMHAPERLVLAALADVAARGGIVANYVQATGIASSRGRVEGVEARDCETGDEFTVRAGRIVNATGPWTDTWSQGMVPGTPSVVLSAGIHLVIDRPPIETAVALQDDQGHFFILPWRGRLLVGTTDERFDAPADEYRIGPDDVSRFTERIAAAVPELELRQADVRHAYGGLRALVAQGSDTYRASRRAEITSHHREGCDGLYTVLGGKWTTSRALAEAVVGRFARGASTTASRSLPGAPALEDEHWRERLAAAAPRGLPASAVSQLADLYGLAAGTLLGDIGDEEPLEAAEPVFRAQARHAARFEMARTLPDFIFRRVQLGLLGRPPRETLEALARAMARELGWTPGRVDDEVRAVEGSYLT